MKKKILAFLMTLVMLLGTIPAVSFAADYMEYPGKDGIGTITQFKISSVETLKELSSDCNAGANFEGITFHLAKDLEEVGSFTPIGIKSATEGFSGVFDGGGHSISGLVVNTDNIVAAGLFGLVKNGTVKNLKLEGNITATARNQYVGGLIGRTTGAVTVENCQFTGSVELTNTEVTNPGLGGIVGRVNSGTVSIDKCANFGTITSENTHAYAGGILGYASARNQSIQNCYNTGNIKAGDRVGGILCGAPATYSVKNCYNIGTLETTNGGKVGAITGWYNSGTIANCFALSKDADNIGGTGTIADDAIMLISSKAELLGKLGDEFKADTGINGGYPILNWQGGSSSSAVPAPPEIKIGGTKNGSTELFMDNSSTKPSTTLVARCQNMPGHSPIVWNLLSGEDVVATETPEGIGADNNGLKVTAIKPGIAKIKASTDYDSVNYTDTFTVKVMPYITSAELKGTPVAGKSFSATVIILGGSEYDYDTMPELTGFTWAYYDRESGDEGKEVISGAKGPSITVPSGAKGKYLEVKLTYNGGEVSNLGFKKRLLVVDGDTAAVADDKTALSLDTSDIKEVTTLSLPSAGAKGSTIAWASSNETLINPATGAVSLPESGKVTVTLTATLTKGGESATKNFDIVVWSKAAVSQLTAGDRLDEVATKLGSLYKLSPKFGTDTNVLTMFRSKLTSEGFTDVNAAVKTVTPKLASSLLGDAAVAADGTVSYFYIDPNQTPALRSGSFDVTFTISKDGAEKDIVVPVTFGWDVNKVKAVMKSNILDKVTAESLCGAGDTPEGVTRDLTLPNVYGDKSWTLITWESSDDSVISIDDMGRQVLGPFTGKVKPQTLDSQVTLTGNFKFQFTASDGSEEEIILSKVYNLTVKGDGGAGADAVKAALNSKLEAGFAKAGIRDFVTGEILDRANVKNDIQLPTTKDFGIDGKLFPVTLKSSNTEVLTVPKTNNSARAYVYRPLGGEDKNVTLTLTITDKASGVSVSRDIELTIKPITDGEIEEEIALMKWAKEHYFDGIKGDNTSEDKITKDLKPFLEVYKDGAGNFKWVRDVKDMANHGIIAAPIPNWQDLEQWRLFKSSNAAVITNENLLVTRGEESKAVTVSSYLSSETLGKYQERYPNDQRFKALYNQPVSVELIVLGTEDEKTLASGGTVTKPVSKKLEATVSIKSAKESWLKNVKVSGISEGSTVFDVFARVARENGYTYGARGSYIYAITNEKGKTLGEFDEGADSGWMYKVDGVIPSVYMAAYTLSGGENIEVFYTRDYTKESKGMGGTAVSAEVKVENLAEPVATEEKADDNAVAASKKFTDVPANSYYAEHVGWALKKGITLGVDATHFGPSAYTSRDQLMTMMARLDGKSAKTLTEGREWAMKSGISDGSNPSRFISREDLSTMMYRYAKSKGLGFKGEWTTKLDFKDAGDISAYANEAMSWMVMNKVIQGTGNGMVSPKALADRGQIVTMLSRFDRVVNNNN